MPRRVTETAAWSTSGLSTTITRGAPAVPARFVGSAAIASAGAAQLPNNRSASAKPASASSAPVMIRVALSGRHQARW